MNLWPEHNAYLSCIICIWLDLAFLSVLVVLSVDIINSEHIQGVDRV